MEEYIRIAWRNLRRRKLRSWLTVIGILVSVSIIFVLISLSVGLSQAVEEQFRLLGTDKLFVQPLGQLAGPGTGGAVTLTEEDIDVIEDVNGVKKTTYWVSSPSKVEFRDQIRYFSVIGIPGESADIFLEGGLWNVDEGKFFEKGDSGIIGVGSQYKRNNIFERPVELGDKLLLNDKEYRVKTIMEPLGNPGDDRLILMEVEDFRELFPNIKERVDQVTVQVDEGRDIDQVADKIEEKLLNARGLEEETKDFTILTPENLLDTIGNVLNIITGFLLGVAAISLVVGSIGITNTMYTSVLERTKEIGVMKAVGARNRDVLSLFAIEAGLIGLMGGVIGVLLGSVFVKGVEFIALQSGLGFFKASMPFYLIAGCLIFSFAVGALSGTWPAWKASNIKPVDALRYE